MCPFRMRDLPDQRISISPEKCCFPAIPAPLVIKEPPRRPSGSQQLHSVQHATCDQLRTRSGPLGSRTPGGALPWEWRSRPRPRRPAEAGREGSRRPAVPHATMPGRSLSQSCLAQPAAPPQLRAFPRGSTKPYLPPCRAWPCLSLARCAPLNWSGA